MPQEDLLNKDFLLAQYGKLIWTTNLYVAAHTKSGKITGQIKKLNSTCAYISALHLKFLTSWSLFMYPAHSLPKLLQTFLLLHNYALF